MLKFENVTKKYGDTAVFEDFSFELPKSGVFAVLGKKSDVKTALLDTAAGCLAPSAGKVLIAGADVYANPAEARKKIAYSPAGNCFFREMTALEFLIFIGDARGVPREKLYKKIDEVVDIAGLDNTLRRLVRNLDAVAYKRLCIAAAVIGNPDLIVFDGLFDGIPRGKTGEFKTLVKMFGEMKPVLLGLSYTSSVLEVCDGVIDTDGKKLILASDLAGESFSERFSPLLPSEEEEPKNIKEKRTDGINI